MLEISIQNDLGDNLSAVQPRWIRWAAQYTTFSYVQEYSIKLVLTQMLDNPTGIFIKIKSHVTYRTSLLFLNDPTRGRGLPPLTSDPTGEAQSYKLWLLLLRKSIS